MKKDSKAQPQENKGTIITLRMSVEDSVRLQQALAEGKLEGLGITCVSIVESESRNEQEETTQKQWTKTARPKGIKKQTGEELPPLL